MIFQIIPSTAYAYNGFVVRCINDDELIGWLFGEPRDTYCWLFDLRVSKDHRRKGIATKLMKMAMEEAKKRGYVLVRFDVFKNNGAAILLYRSLGCKFIDMRWSDGNLLMQKNLLPERKPLGLFVTEENVAYKVANKLKYKKYGESLPTDTRMIEQC